MPETLSQPLRDWQNFYLLIGGAAATLAGLMFLAISLGARLITPQSTPALRVFVSPTLLHFIYVLVTASVALIPTVTRMLLGVLLVIVGIVSFGWAVSTFPFLRRQYRLQLIDRHDWAWYFLTPSVSYLLFAGTGIGLLSGVSPALNGVALASLLLLVTGIRNAWDLLMFMLLNQAELPKRETGTESLGPADSSAPAERQTDPVAQPPKEDVDRPPSRALPPSHQADVVRLIQEAGLTPSDFTWAVQPSRYALIGPLVSALVHAPTAWYFRFEFNESATGKKRVSVFISGEGAREMTKAATSWEDQLGHVRAWLKRLIQVRK